MSTHTAMVSGVSAMPPFCITNNEVTRINAAQPFILIVVQIGNTKRETCPSTPILSSAHCIVTGNVAAELLVKKAISMAGDMHRNTLSGLSPLDNRNNGSTKTNCNTLPPTMTAT